MNILKRFSKNESEPILDVDNWFVGINISSGVSKLEASLIGTTGTHEESSIVLSKSVSFDLPQEVVQAFGELRNLVSEYYSKEDCDIEESKLLGGKREVSRRQTSGAQKNSGSVLIRLAELRMMITSVEEEAFEELLKYAGVAKERVVAVAVNDPGLWIQTSLGEERSCFVLSDGYSLASRLKVNVIDSFIGKENNFSRQNILLTSYWTLLGNYERSKLLVDLGESARWYYIPSRKDDSQSWKMLRFKEVVPCGSLLNALTKQASKGEQDIDHGGKYSVQGRCVTELLDFWRAGIESFKTDPRVFPKKWISTATNIINETYYIEKLLSFDSKVSGVDALCTSVHWIVEQIYDSISTAFTTTNDQTYDLVLMGGGKLNGLLFNKLTIGFEPGTIHSLSEYGNFQEDAFEATATALLGMFVVLDKPIGFHNGIDLQESVVGRITCGTKESAQNLKRFQNRFFSND